MKEIHPNIMEEVAKVFISLALLGAFGLFFRLYNALVVKPEKLKSIMRNQGISGPPPSLLLGNIKEIKNSKSKVVKNSSIDTHNCAAALFPFFEQWQNKYGRIKFSSFVFFLFGFTFCVLHSSIQVLVYVQPIPLPIELGLKGKYSSFYSSFILINSHKGL